MAENSLIQFAQMATELPNQDRPSSFQDDNPRPDLMHHRCPVRKNACIVCCICFTCSKVTNKALKESNMIDVTKYYGHSCSCSEVQPRRGKNLPEGSLDSRAKKLHPEDQDDYEFSLKWLMENASAIYRDNTGRVAGLEDLTEVSLCKAHSSTLYRAKKRHERNKNQAPPSPADSNPAMDDRRPPLSPTMEFSLRPTSGLAAKVHEISVGAQHSPYQLSLHDSPDSPDFSHMSSSTSYKRKRTTKSFDHKPHSSASTPLCASGFSPLLSHRFNPPTSSYSAISPSSRSPVNNLPSQLPPLHARTPSLSSLSSSLQHQLQLSPYPSICLPSQNSSGQVVVETVSLKSSLSSGNQYFVRNLAITDTFTFRNLLSEIDMTGPVPPGKQIVVSDVRNERIFPLDQAIRNVIRHPSLPHVELCIGLRDKPSIDWSKYS